MRRCGKRIAFGALALLAGLSSCGRIGFDAEEEPVPDPLDGVAGVGACGALPPPTGTTVAVGPEQSSELPDIVAAAQPGTTILLEDGRYDLSGGDERHRIQIFQDDITIRSASGVPGSVVLDAGFNTNVVFELAASNVTLAELTIANATGKGREAAIQVAPPSSNDIVGTRIYRVRVIDAPSMAISIGPTLGSFADKGVVECSEFRLDDRAAARSDCSSRVGVRGVAALDWRLTKNHFSGYHCRDDRSVAVRSTLWIERSQKIRLEGNVFIDANIPIGIGLSPNSAMPLRALENAGCDGAGYVEIADVQLCNNVLRATDGIHFDSGIGLWNVCNAEVLHNTIIVADSQDTGGGAIEWRYDTSAQLLVANNLSNHPLKARDGAQAVDMANVVVEAFDGVLEPRHFALVNGPDNPALGAGQFFDSCSTDIEGDPRSSTPDVGADERPVP